MPRECARLGPRASPREIRAASAPPWRAEQFCRRVTSLIRARSSAPVSLRASARSPGRGLSPIRSAGSVRPCAASPAADRGCRAARRWSRRRAWDTRALARSLQPGVRSFLATQEQIQSFALPQRKSVGRQLSVIIVIHRGDTTRADKLTDGRPRALGFSLTSHTRRRTFGVVGRIISGPDSGKGDVMIAAARKRPAFTLFQLLVVLAILGLLIGLAL